MNLRRTRAMARKEFIHILRDPRSLIMAIAMPLMMLLLFSYALSLDVDRIPTIVYDQDRTPESREMAARFSGSRYFNVLGNVESYAPVEDRLNHSKIIMSVVIPIKFAAHLHSGVPTQVQVLLDGSDSNTASIALNYADSVITSYAISRAANTASLKRGLPVSMALDPRMRVWYNSELKSRNYIIPGLIAVILMIIAALLTSLTIAREWENGTMEQLLSTPLRPAEMVIGKISAFFVLGVIDMALALIVGVIGFGVPLRGNLLLLMSVAFVFLFGALAWGILISALAKSQLLAYQMGLLSSFLPAFLLSGFVYAIDSMPRVIQLVTYIVPARYFVAILKGIFLKGSGLEIIGFEFLLLGVYAAVVFFVATMKVGNKVA